MDDTFLFLIGLLLLFFVIIFLGNKNNKANQSISNELDAEIIVKQKHLTHIENQINNKTLDRATALTNVQIEVLDIYDNSNIKIPIDIIEDLQHMKLYEYQDIIEYIENQRYFWKLENTKKPFRKKGL